MACDLPESEHLVRKPRFGLESVRVLVRVGVGAWVCVCVSLPSTWEKRVTPDRCLFYAATCFDKTNNKFSQA